MTEPIINGSDLNTGDEVYLIGGYAPSLSNPCKGSGDECTGIVIRKVTGITRIQWSNGEENVYIDTDEFIRVKVVDEIPEPEPIYPVLGELDSLDQLVFGGLYQGENGICVYLGLDNIHHHTFRYEGDALAVYCDANVSSDIAEQLLKSVEPKYTPPAVGDLIRVTHNNNNEKEQLELESVIIGFVDTVYTTDVIQTAVVLRDIVQDRYHYLLKPVFTVVPNPAK